MLNEILAAIHASQRCLITTHESPDGDAIGSALGLSSYLTKIGKTVTVHVIDPVPALYAFLPGAESVRQNLPDDHFDITFVLDVGEYRRAGKQIAAAQHLGTVVNIDHHASCELFGTLNLIDTSAAATGILVHRIMKAGGYSLDYETALCLYVAVLTDTGSFRYSNSNPEAFIACADFVACGINAWDVAEKLYENQPKARLLLLAQALRHLSVHSSGLFASLAVTMDMYAATGASAELTDGFINYPRSISGVEVALFFRETAQGTFKVGFRSKGKIDVAALAACFGGGGHHNAAGCSLDGSLADVQALMYARLSELLLPSIH